MAANSNRYTTAVLIPTTASSKTPLPSTPPVPARSRETGQAASSAGCCRPTKNKDTFSSRAALRSVVFGRLGRRCFCVPSNRIRQTRLRGLMFPLRRHRDGDYDVCNKNEKIIEANHQNSICQKGHRSCQKV